MYRYVCPVTGNTVRLLTRDVYVVLLETPHGRVLSRSTFNDYHKAIVEFELLKEGLKFSEKQGKFDKQMSSVMERSGNDDFDIIVRTPIDLFVKESEPEAPVFSGGGGDFGGGGASGSWDTSPSEIEPSSSYSGDSSFE